MRYDKKMKGFISSMLSIVFVFIPINKIPEAFSSLFSQKLNVYLGKMMRHSGKWQVENIYRGNGLKG